MLKELVRSAMPAQALGLLRSAKLYYSTKTYQPRKVRHDYCGRPLSVHINDSTAELWYDRDWHERPEISFLTRYGLKIGATVFNLGAHQGVVALIMAGLVGDTGRVVALEASPYNARILELNRAANNANNLRALNAAIAAQPGKLKFADSLCGHVDDGHGGIEVDARTIDDLADEFGQPTVLYIDVEGFECEALRGAAKTLEIGSDCFVEVHGGVGLEKYGGSAGELLSFFAPDDYALFFSENDESGFAPLIERDEVVVRLAGKRWFLVATHKPRPSVAA